MPQNVELKARLADRTRANHVARDLGADDHGILNQVDTFFVSSNGRLKLREINGERAELIWYARPDDTEAKLSHYIIAPVSDPRLLQQCLETAWGVETTVRKERRLWIYRNVRIHLDRVDQLGDFLEFEAVLDDEHSAEEGCDLVADLRQKFSLTNKSLIAGSYRELMLALDLNG